MTDPGMFVSNFGFQRTKPCFILPLAKLYKSRHSMSLERFLQIGDRIIDTNNRMQWRDQHRKFWKSMVSIF